MIDQNAANQAAANDSMQVESGILTTDQLQQILDADVADGRITREQASEMMAEQGIGAETPKIDARTDLQKQFDADFPAARPHEFELPMLDESMPDAERMKVAQKFGTILADARFPRGTGSFVAKEVERSLQQTQNMNDAEWGIHVASERTKLERIFGDELPAKLDAAWGLLGELEKKHPGLHAFLDKAGALSNAGVITQLISHANMLRSRAGG